MVAVVALPKPGCEMLGKKGRQAAIAVTGQEFVSPRVHRVRQKAHDLRTTFDARDEKQPKADRTVLP